MLEASNITAGYAGIQVLWDVSLKVEKGEFVALVGANGAGKSTLRKMGGKVSFEQKDISALPAHAVVAQGIALVPEGRRVFPYMTVRENLEWVFGLFPKLRERQKQLAGTFSGGEQQMLVIGRALMSRPRFLMLDEPSLGLQPNIVAGVFQSLKLLHGQGVTILLVEQNVRKSLEIAERGYVLEHGRVVMSGAGKELLADEGVRRAYLGI